MRCLPPAGQGVSFLHKMRYDPRMSKIKKQNEPPKKTGRPSKYTPEIAQEIVERPSE